jgi:hypothetical protein
MKHQILNACNHYRCSDFSLLKSGNTEIFRRDILPQGLAGFLAVHPMVERG